ncbi:MAG: hypothetical protein ACJ8GV_01405 [Luteimonas sp.]
MDDRWNNALQIRSVGHDQDVRRRRLWRFDPQACADAAAARESATRPTSSPIK